MDSFANYDSDSDASGGDEKPSAEAVKENPTETPGTAIENEKGTKEGPETKKRRVLPKPGAAMSSALPSFLAKKTDDADHFSSITESKETPPAHPDPPQEDSIPGKPAAAPQPAAALAATTAALAAEDARKKEKEKETTRQKNTRKQKMGQANFTVKDGRECPDIWRG